MRVALFAGLGPLAVPPVAGLQSRQQGSQALFRGETLLSSQRRHAPEGGTRACFEGRGRARPFLSQDAGSVGGVYRSVG